MIDTQARDEFWSIVEECLQEIHQLSPVDAVQRSRALRQRLKTPPAGIPLELSGELIFHEEPFDVACDLAGNPLELSRYRTEYDAILNRYNW